MAATLTQHTDRSIIGSHVAWSVPEKVSESFWFSLCLLLFMVLGPFSAPIVLGYIFFGRIGNRRFTEPDPVADQL